MEKLKQYKYIILIVLVILGFTFYWFQVRPSQARKGCIKIYPQAFRIVSGDSISGRLGLSDKAGYEKCLREHGLEK